MWHWKNNGPRDPLDPEDVLLLTCKVMFIVGLYWIISAELQAAWNIFAILTDPLKH